MQAEIKKNADSQTPTLTYKIHQNAQELPILFCFFLNNTFFAFFCNKIPS
jgi:hypothetical protein